MSTIELVERGLLPDALVRQGIRRLCAARLEEEGIADPARHSPPRPCPKGRLGHDERVVGDDKAGVPRGADILFDKAAAEMRAGRMNALAAPVG